MDDKVAQAFADQNARARSHYTQLARIAELETTLRGLRGMAEIEARTSPAWSKAIVEIDMVLGS